MRNSIDCLKELQYKDLNDTERLELIDELLRLEYKTLENLCHRYESETLIYDDLLQEALITLSSVYENYDLDSEISFSEFYIPLIEKRIEEMKEEESTLKSEVEHLANRLNDLLDTEKALRKRLKRDPEHEEIAKELNITHEELDELRDYAKEVLGVNYDTEELIIDLIDKNSESLVDEDTVEKANEQLDVLTNEEREIISLLFGLNGEKPLSIDEVANMYHVSTERIRQIKNVAILKMREDYDA